MNRQCMECNAIAGSQVLRNAANEWVMLGEDCCFYAADGTRFKMHELSDEFQDSDLVTVEVSIVRDGDIPRCLCQHCRSQRREREASTTNQTNFFHLVDTRD